jgi:hypothetical protein
VDLLSEGILTREEGEGKLRRLRNERTELQAQLLQLDESAKAVSSRQAQIEAVAGFLQRWEERLRQPFTEAEKRRCIEAFVTGIVVREGAGETVATYRLCFAPPAGEPPALAAEAEGATEGGYGARISTRSTEKRDFQWACLRSTTMAAATSCSATGTSGSTTRARR